MTLKKGDVLFLVWSENGPSRIHVVLEPHYYPDHTINHMDCLIHDKLFNGTWRTNTLLICWSGFEKEKYIVRDKTKLNIIYKSLINFYAMQMLEKKREMDFFTKLLSE